jgi:hypothetical protein
MMKAIGFVIVLYAITQLVDDGFRSFEQALSATFETVEVAATISQQQLHDMSH